MGGESTRPPVNVLICGVGGQGVILASDIMSAAAMEAGLDVKQSEIHGMSQRGGSVVTHIRFGPRVASPLISKGQADVLLSFELLETLRYLDFLRPEGVVVVNDNRVVPTTVSSGPFKYPDDIVDHIVRNASAIVVDGLAIAREVGNVRAVNSAMLGALSTRLDLSMEVWTAAIYKSVPDGVERVNLQAFEEGRKRAELLPRKP